MKDLKIAFTVFLVFNQFNSLCTKGCLKCDTLNQCLFCDYTKGYELNNFSCIEKPVKNCLHFSLFGECL